MDSLSPQDIAGMSLCIDLHFHFDFDFDFDLDFFATKFYNDFNTDREEFIRYFYREHSTLTFESNIAQGIEAIGQKWFNDFPKTATMTVTTKDAQRVPGGLVLVVVTGLLKLVADEKGLNFTQSFIISIDEKGVFCYNDVFKLVYG
ncbi:nuclear transport factor 2 domain-containing protein [Xylaria cf. heliscus]|nr:nuclear transport factor 2 domain-containing protein [Xylaria cf. heliscus]